MEDLRSSRRHRGSAPPKSAYADVFGGPPKFSAAKSDDYAEIFGGGADSCNIPFLDLPQPPPMNQTGGGPIDYEEIFGKKSNGAADCGLLDYEELFGKKKKGSKKEKKKEKEKEVSCSSSDGRTPKEAEFDQQEKDTSKVYGEGACTEKNLFSPSSMYSDDGSKIFSMSYSKTSRGSIEDVLNGSTHVTQLHAVPGYSSTIDSLQGMQTDNSPKVVKNDHIFSAGYNGGVTAEEQVNIVPSTFPEDGTKSCEADLKTYQKEFTNRRPVPEGATANVRQEEATANAQHHSRSSSNHSTSSGDVSFPDITYVTISDISLRTQPSQVPPPSRAPPKLVSKQGQPKMKTYGSFRTELEGTLPKTTGGHKTHYSLGVSKSHSLSKTAKDGSPFLDVEVDASSAAAAMKEAMEQAQARLKSAKELMERKRENLQNRKKLGLHENIIFDEKTENKAANEVKSFSEVKTSKTLLKEEGTTKEYSLEEREKSLTTAKAAPIEVKERYVVSAREDQEIVEGNRFKTPHTSYKLEDISGEWKMNQEFYELVKSKNNSPVVEEVYKQEDLQKNQKIGKKVNEHKENYVKVAELSCDERNGKSQQVNETSERIENVEHLSTGNMAFYEKIWEIPNTILKACTGKENLSKLHEVPDSLPRRENERKLEAFEEAHVSKNELEKLHIVEGVIEENYSSGESKTSVESSETCEFEGVALGEENRLKLEAAEEDCGCNNEEELGGTSVSSITLDTENRQNKAGTDGMQAKTENGAQGISHTCMLEAVDEKRREADSEYGVEEYGYKSEGNHSALEEQNRSLHSDREAGIFVVNGLQSEEVQNANQSEADLEKHEAVQDILGHTEHEKITESTEEVSLQDLNEIQAREAEGEIHHYEEKQKAAQEHCKLENLEEAVVSEEGPKKMDTEEVGEVHMSVALDEMHKRSDADKDVCQRNVEECPEDVQQTSLWEKKFKLQNSAEASIESHQINSQSLAQAATEKHHTLLTESAAPDMHESEKRENIRRDGREKEKEKEQARNLEEEKEREREREKDRLAVERATREAHARKIAEARERAERIAVERVTAEARQRALAEAREKADKAAAEALEKSLAEKSLKEAKLRAERAAVERATAEARERAVEKALAEKAASDARQRAERLNATSRDSRATDREDKETKLKPSFVNVPPNARFQGASSAISSQKYKDSYFHGEGDSPLRCKARLERHQRTVERAAKALAEKNMRDILAQREQAERNRLSESLDADVKRWSTGKEGNLRALLSTLQYILGPDSGWQPIPLTDVITAVAVKKAYRKATLCVHPDKLQQRGASIQQKYICEKVFDLLKEAWNRFNSEER